jgi:hypothetical protein
MIRYYFFYFCLPYYQLKFFFQKENQTILVPTNISENVRTAPGSCLSSYLTE